MAPASLFLLLWIRVARGDFLLGNDFVFLKGGLLGLAVRPAPGWLRQQYGILPRASLQKNKVIPQKEDRA